MTEVGCSWGGTRLAKRNLRTSIYWTSNSAKNVREHWACAWAGAAGMQSGSRGRGRSGRNRGAAAEADTNREQQLQRKLQLKRTQSESSSWSGHKREQQLKRINAIGEQHLKRMQSGSSSSAQRAVRCRITHVGERGGSSWASEASEATCTEYL